MDKETTYKDAGVDVEAGNTTVLKMKEYIRSSFTPNVLTDVGSFGGMFALDMAGYESPVLVSSIDGVGTKLKLAFMANKHEGVGHDLVNHCVNDILVQGAKPLFFLDYFATGKLDPAVVVEVVKGLSDACIENGCVLIGGETAEMPGFYLEGEYDMAGCIVGIVDRPKIIDGSKTEPGDVLVGITSNGLHTNGFSLARHVLLEKSRMRIDQYVDEIGATLGDELLKPHRCYARIVGRLMKEFEIHGMAHITGGGFYDNIPRALPPNCQAAVEKRTWEPPAIFGLIQSVGGIPVPEMYRTFNMGIGYVLVVPKEQATAIIARIIEDNGMAYMIGEVRRGSREVQVL